MFAACGSHTITTVDYLDAVAEATTKMTADSVAALQQNAAPTHLQVSVIVGLRRDALEAISAIDPPADVLPEHLALVDALTGLVESGEAFLVETAGIDQTGFLAALDASTEIDTLATVVHGACVAMEQRAIALDHPVTMDC